MEPRWSLEWEWVMPPIGTLGGHLLSHLGSLPWLLLSQSAYTLRFLDWTNPIPKWSSPHCSPQELTTTKQFDERKSQITYLWIKRIILKDLFGSHIYVIFPSNSLAFWLIRITLVSLLHKCLWSQKQRVCFESLNFLDLRMTPQVVLSCCYRI